MKPSERSTKYLRDQGFIVANVEKWIPIPGKKFKVTKDAFGFADLLIAKPDFGAALVQVTDSSSIPHRVKKILGIAHDLTDEKQVADAIKAAVNADTWLRAGQRIFVQGWAKRGPRGEKKRWKLLEREIVLRDGIMMVMDTGDDDEREDGETSSRYVRRDRAGESHPRRRSKVREYHTRRPGRTH